MTSQQQWRRWSTLEVPRWGRVHTYSGALWTPNREIQGQLGSLSVSESGPVKMEEMGCRRIGREGGGHVTMCLFFLSVLIANKLYPLRQVKGVIQAKSIKQSNFNKIIWMKEV